MSLSQHFKSDINGSNLGSNLDNIKILNRVRLIAIVGQSLLILIAVTYLEAKLPITSLAILIIVEVLFELYSYQIIRTQRKTSSIELFLHIVFDSLILAGLIYCSGGSNNPFIYLLLLSVALSSFMLAPGYLFLITLLQVSLYSLLYLFQNPLELAESSPLVSFHLHLAGMWVNFILTTSLIAVFGLLARYAMLNQEKKIQALREKNLQDEQVLGLGIMAANAAHELATPLSTMAIIVEDLQHEKLTKETTDDINLLSSQITKCKNIIGVLSDKSKNAQQQLLIEENSSTTNDMPLFVERVERIIETWLVYRPQIIMKLNTDERLSLIKQNITMSVEQAITNILDNAADASLANNKDSITVNLTMTNKLDIEQSIIINIVDFGSGIPEELKGGFGGKIQQTSKQSGLGWGTFLSNVSIERVGGRVQVSDHESGGTLTEIILPLVKV